MFLLETLLNNKKYGRLHATKSAETDKRLNIDLFQTMHIVFFLTKFA